jgi:predicted dehydrogenase
MGDNKILLVGAGYMAREYAKVLDAMGADYDVAGRGAASAAAFRSETGHEVIENGMERLAEAGRLGGYTHAIVAASVDTMAGLAGRLAEAGVRDILLEKPGGGSPDEIRSLCARVADGDARVYIGYNRRHYASARKARELIAEDGGVSSFRFEFTEWAHVIEPLEKSAGIKQQWFLANSTHVVDLAFYLGGIPEKLSAYTAGSLPWHSRAAVFSGAGVSAAGALFSYAADWTAPGRWGVELMTRKRRLIFRPLEQLKAQAIGSVAVEDVEIDDALDRAFKPGLYREVSAFTGAERDGLMSLREQCDVLPVYEAILEGREYGGA